MDPRWLKIIEVADHALQQLSPRVPLFLARHDLTLVEVHAVWSTIDNFCLQLTEIIESMENFKVDHTLIATTAISRSAFIELRQRFELKISDLNHQSSNAR